MNDNCTRKKFVCDVTDPTAAINTINTQLSAGNWLDALDVLELMAEKYGRNPGFENILAGIYDAVYAKIKAKESRYVLYVSRFFDFNIKPTDKVLDIGSGNMPFIHATHLADFALEDNGYGRAGAAFKRLDGRMVTSCSVEDMPFADKEFDFVYCSHVLEHVDSPEKACRELMRVAKRGYIETPVRGRDIFFDYAKISNHIWNVRLFDGTLCFEQKSPQDILGFGCDVLNHIMESPETAKEKAFAALTYLRADLLNNMFYWEDGFDFEVRRIGDKRKVASPSAQPAARAAAVPSACPTESIKNTWFDIADSASPAAGSEQAFGPDSISVVIPAHNRAHTLKRAIDSAINQTYPVDEIIIGDDASTDNTRELIAEMAERDPRIRIFSHSTNKGAQAARNTAIKNARGGIIAFQDSDDEWLPGWIEKGLAAMKAADTRAVYSLGLMRRDGQDSMQDMRRLSGNIYADLLVGPTPMFQGLMVRKEALEEIGLLDERVPSYQEWDTSLRLAEFNKFAFLNEPTFIWHWHPGETISKDAKREIEGYLFIVEKHREKIIEYCGIKTLMDHYLKLLKKCQNADQYDMFNGIKQELQKLIEMHNRSMSAEGGQTAQFAAQQV